jgi:hypothetical protein
VVKLVESLRSSVSKIALITLYEMLESLPKVMVESSIDAIFNVLIKKCSDSSVFVAEEVEKTMMCLCR